MSSIIIFKCRPCSWNHSLISLISKKIWKGWACLWSLNRISYFTFYILLETTLSLSGTTGGIWTGNLRSKMCSTVIVEKTVIPMFSVPGWHKADSLHHTKSANKSTAHWISFLKSLSVEAGKDTFLYASELMSTEGNHVASSEVCG